MKDNFQQAVVRRLHTWARPCPIARWSGVLGALVFLVLLCPRAHAVTLPVSESAVLAWDRSSSSSVAGYRVYYGVASGLYTTSVEAGNATTNTVPGLLGGVAYFFAVKAYDTNGVESAFSNEIRFVPGLSRLQVLLTAAGQAALTVMGPVGHTYEIQATPDLKVWTVIGTVTIGPGGSLNFTDANAPGFATRFYRALDIGP